MATHLRRSAVGLLVSLAAWLPVAPAMAVAIYVDIPGLRGGNATPGFPEAFAVDSMSVASHGFSVTRGVDPLTVPLHIAVIQGTFFPGATVALYNSLPPGPQPDATLAFPQLVASSQQLSGLNETDGFRSTAPALLFLSLPGIAGGESTPGFAGLIAIQSFTLAGNRLTIAKSVDATTPALFDAVALGRQFAAAEILLYDTLTPGATPDETLIFDRVGAASQQIGGIIAITEQDGFVFTTLSQPAAGPPPGPMGVAEPSSLLLLLAALGSTPLLLRLRRNARRRKS